MVVLRSKLSGYYFKDFGVWTLCPGGAKAFPDQWVARTFVQDEHLEDVQLAEQEILTLDLNMAA